MNIENVKMLAEIMVHSGVNMLELVEGETKIHMERNPMPLLDSRDINCVRSAADVIEYQNGSVEPSSVLYASPIEPSSAAEVRSPMVGVFYASPAPEAENYVSIGSKVKKGDVLCIVEAMKLLNEITSEQDGEIVEICVANGSVVEFGQVLFKLQ